MGDKNGNESNRRVKIHDISQDDVLFLYSNVVILDKLQSIFTVSNTADIPLHILKR